jgi:putative nucleotidyltransferase with HDIG domain
MYGSPVDVTAMEILAVTKTNNISKDLFVNLGTAIIREMNSAGDRMRKRLDTEQGIIMLMDAWSHLLELRDPGTYGHSQRVTILALRLARAVGVKKEQLIRLHRGGMLHDIGKLGIKDSIIMKAGPLTEDETNIMHSHPGIAFEMLSKINYLQNMMDVPFCHHEKWDGTGYPRRVKGLEIPEIARIFSICDVYDALTTKRPYREAWTAVKALEYIESESHRYFDPAIANKFLEMMKEGEQ